MIDVQARQQLAEVLAALKRANEAYYRQLLQAIRDCVDPEHKKLVDASADTILGQQGRTRFGVELLEVVYECEKIVSPPAAPRPASLIGGING